MKTTKLERCRGLIPVARDVLTCTKLRNKDMRNLTIAYLIDNGQITALFLSVNPLQGGSSHV